MRTVVVVGVVSAVCVAVLVVGSTTGAQPAEKWAAVREKWKTLELPAVIEVTLPDVTDQPKGEGVTGGTFRCGLNPLVCAKCQSSPPVQITWQRRGHLPGAPPSSWFHVTVDANPTVVPEEPWEWTVQYHFFDARKGEPGKLTGGYGWTFKDRPMNVFAGEADGVSWKPVESPWKIRWAPTEAPLKR